jgi:hypothetical protein
MSLYVQRFFSMIYRLISYARGFVKKTKRTKLLKSWLLVLMLQLPSVKEMILRVGFPQGRPFCEQDDILFPQLWKIVFELDIFDSRDPCPLKVGSGLF